MAFVSKAKPKKTRIASSPQSIAVALPQEYETPPDEINQYTYLIYGERKIGKTALASQFPNPFFLGFEPIGKSVRARKVLVNTWEEYLQYLDLLKKNPSYADTIIIDNVAFCYERCFDHVMRGLGVEKPKDLDGWDSPMAWKTVEKTFYEANQILFTLDKGLIFTAHSEVREFTRRDQTKYHKLSIQLSRQAMKYYASVVDMIAYFQYDNIGNRVLTIRGDETVDAGCRMGEQFLFTDGTPIKDLTMGENPKQAYKNFVDGFHNKMKNPDAVQVKGGLRKKV